MAGVLVGERPVDVGLGALERGVDLLGFLVGGEQTVSIHRRAPSWSQTHRRPGQFTIQDPNAGASILATAKNRLVRH